jgi:hypothetical protein
MSLPADSQKAIDDYLAALRRQLRDLMEEDMNDIVEEIRAHILDKTSSGVTSVEQTLAALGPPAALAARYRTEEIMRRRITSFRRAKDAARRPHYQRHPCVHPARRAIGGQLFCRRCIRGCRHRQGDVAAGHGIMGNAQL